MAQGVNFGGQIAMVVVIIARGDKLIRSPPFPIPHHGHCAQVNLMTDTPIVHIATVIVVVPKTLGF